MEPVQQDKTLWQKLRDWFRELTDKLKTAIDAYQGYTPDSPEGRMVAQMEGALEVLQQAFAEGLVDASSNYAAAKGQKNTTREGGSVLEQARDNKKSRASNSSPLSRRSVKQRSAGSTHPIMSSTAAAGILGISNIANSTDDVKRAVSILAEMYESVGNPKPILGLSKPIFGSNLEGSLISTGILHSVGTGGSAYRKDGEHELRMSNHSAHAENFKGAGEHLSIALYKTAKVNKFLPSEQNVIEAVFKNDYLDKNPKALKALINDIAHFIAKQNKALEELLEEQGDQDTVSSNYAAAKGQKNTTREGGVMMQARAGGYDYSKPFEMQVDDWLKQDGTFPQNDTLLMGRTPRVLLDIGVPALPVTITQKNLRENLLGQYKGSPQEIADHKINLKEFKDLPNKIANPVAIIADRRLVRNRCTVSESAIDVLVEMQIN